MLEGLPSYGLHLGNTVLVWLVSHQIQKVNKGWAKKTKKKVQEFIKSQATLVCNLTVTNSKFTWRLCSPVSEQVKDISLSFDCLLNVF